MSVRQLRVVVTADDYDEALRFYRDVLGLPELGAFSGEHGRVSILDAGRATLELSDPAHADYIDEVEVGARVAAHLSLGKQEAEFIHYHHENFDGTGYPMGLAGAAIPQGARILAVAEAYDCMVSSERRQGRLSPTAALRELEVMQGSQFDPHVVAAFKNVMLKRSA